MTFAKSTIRMSGNASLTPSGNHLVLLETATRDRPPDPDPSRGLQAFRDASAVAGSAKM